MAKLLLEAVDIEKSYGLNTVLKIDRFEVYDGDRIGLMGENGAGKSTFLKILSGELMPDAGYVHRLSPIASISQMGDVEDVDDTGHLGKEFRVQAAREGLSGGERTRRRIAGGFSTGSPLLLADEPTTDLDAAGVERLEKRLKAYEGAVVLVSHDRVLLDSVCTSIAELRDGALEVFPGNYSAYREERTRRQAFQQFEYDQYRQERARLQSAIQGRRERAGQVRLPSRMGNSEARLHKRSATETEESLNKTRKALESRLEHLEVKQRPREDPDIRMALGAHTPITSKTAIEVRDMTIRFGKRTLLEGAGMRVPTGSRTALLGDNGCGKSTLISRICLGKDPRVRISPGVKLGLFDQDHAQTLDPARTVIENVERESVVDGSTVRTILARLNLSERDWTKPTSVLSGGELAKAALARLFVSDVNVLVLDEPTNHLDIYTLEKLQEVLLSWQGTLLFVSHDRAFVRAVATRFVRFEGTSLISHEGTLEDWERRQAASRPQEDLELERTKYAMRLAALASRLSSPKKGDDPLKLNEEYQALLKEMQALSQKS